MKSNFLNIFFLSKYALSNIFYITDCIKIINMVGRLTHDHKYYGPTLWNTKACGYLPKLLLNSETPDSISSIPNTIFPKRRTFKEYYFKINDNLLVRPFLDMLAGEGNTKKVKISFRNPSILILGYILRGFAFSEKNSVKMRFLNCQITF